MTDTKQPEALEIASLLESFASSLGEHPSGSRLRAAQELRRQHARIAELEAQLAAPFQSRVQPWLLACFGPEIAADKAERNHRFLEESLELVQACGCTASEAHQLVDYVFGRPVGEPAQEAGGVMVTLAALCLANGLDMHGAGETELARIWTKVEAIRAKQAAKPKHSPLPEAVEGAVGVTGLRPSPDKLDAERYRWLRNESWAGYNYGKGKPEVALVAVTCDGAGNIRTLLAEEAMDEALDAAIAQEGGKA